MSLVRSPGKTHRDHSRSRKQFVLLPRVKGKGGQKLIIADDDIGGPVFRAFHSISQPDYRLCGDSQLAEESRKMVAEEGMSGHAKRENSRAFIGHGTIVRG